MYAMKQGFKPSAQNKMTCFNRAFNENSMGGSCSALLFDIVCMRDTQFASFSAQQHASCSRKTTAFGIGFNNRCAASARPHYVMQKRRWKRGKMPKFDDAYIFCA